MHVIDENSENDFPFQVVNGNGKGDIHINVSGVPINLLIDFGACCNIVDEKTWGMLKQETQ